MFRNLYAHLRGSRLAQAGTALVVLGALVEALDQLGALDLSGLPVVGSYAPAILAVAGVTKIVLRVAILIMTGLAAQAPEASKE